MDFLIESADAADRPGKLFNIEQDFATVIAPGLHLAFENRRKVRLEGLTILGEAATREIWVCGAGAYVVLKAYLFLTSNALVVGKPVGITLDGSSVGSIDTNTQGCAQFGITVPEGVGAGVRTIRAEFAGDAGYRASAGQGGLTVTRGALYLWPYVRTGRAGTSHPLRAFVRSLPDYVVQPGKQVDFSVDGTAMGSGAVAADGWAASAWAIPSAQPAGSHTAAAAFAGDAWYAPATATAAFNVVR